MQFNDNLFMFLFIQKCGNLMQLFTVHNSANGLKKGTIVSSPLRQRQIILSTPFPFFHLLMSSQRHPPVVNLLGIAIPALPYQCNYQGSWTTTMCRADNCGQWTVRILTLDTAKCRPRRHRRSR